MAPRFRKLRILGATAAAALTMTTLTPGTATADSWLYDPNICTSTNTAVSTVIEGRTIQVRYGWCNGVQYGWGRIIGYASGSSDSISFHVDLDGDRVPDGANAWVATTRNYTMAYPTSSSWQRAFRACYLTSSGLYTITKGCTAWW